MRMHSNLLLFASHLLVSTDLSNDFHFSVLCLICVWLLLLFSILKHRHINFLDWSKGKHGMESVCSLLSYGWCLVALMRVYIYICKWEVIWNWFAMHKTRKMPCLSFSCACCPNPKRKIILLPGGKICPRKAVNFTICNKLAPASERATETRTNNSTVQRTTKQQPIDVECICLDQSSHYKWIFPSEIQHCN